jgi:RNA polymerase sigma factor (sigma-70 family)
VGFTVAQPGIWRDLASRIRKPARTDQQAGGEDDPSARYNDTMSATVREAIGKLPPRQREAVWLYYFRGFKQNEIATIMQIQRGAVGALLFQARSRLAGLLGWPDEGQIP